MEPNIKSKVTDGHCVSSFFADRRRKKVTRRTEHVGGESTGMYPFVFSLIKDLNTQS